MKNMIDHSPFSNDIDLQQYGILLMLKWLIEISSRKNEKTNFYKFSDFFGCRGGWKVKGVDGRESP